MQREQFSGRLATLLTMIGVAVGLGNVWRFPYMMGSNGGSAFLLVYLVFVLIFAIPALSAEWALGRETRKGPIGAFSDAFGKGPGYAIGGLLIFGILVADSYYLVVIGNIAYSAWFSVTDGFAPQNLPQYQAGLANGWLQYGITIALLIATLFVVHKGLQKGIEAISKLFVPVFGVVVLFMVYSALMLDGAPAKFAEFLRPDFSLLGAKELFAATGQACYSLGLGGSLMLMYGSYLRDEHDIPKGALITGLSDTGAALLASLFLIPTILVFGLDMASGPGLIFQTLPQLFNHMPGGRFLALIFLASLTMVAFLSNLAALEVVVTGMTDIPFVKQSRDRVIVIVGVVIGLLILPSALNPSLIGTLDLIFGSGMLVFGSAMAVIAMTWGLGRKATIRQIFSDRETIFSKFMYNWLRFVVPGVLIAVLAGYIVSEMSVSFLE
jgi:NSS family neurotransmitter:Na+ symporter